MVTKIDKSQVADKLETALDAYEQASPESRNDTTRGSVGDRVHSLIRKGLELVGNDPLHVQTLYARGFVNGDDSDTWNTATRSLIAKLRG